MFALSGTVGFVGYGIMSGNEKLYKSVVMPSIHKILDPEAAHRAAILAAKYGFVPLAKPLKDEEILVSFLLYSTLSLESFQVNLFAL